MTNLECNVSDCANNTSGYCCRPNIGVAGRDAKECEQTCCSSFENKQRSANNSMRYDMPNRSLDIDCGAMNCTYNADGKCSADVIRVDGDGGPTSLKTQTQCATFLSGDH